MHCLRLLHRSITTSAEWNQGTWSKIYYNELRDETMSEVNPFKLRNFLSDKWNRKAYELTTDSKNWFSFKVKSILQLNLLCDIKKFEDICEMTFHNFLKQTKGIIYLQNCEFNEEFTRSLKEAYPFNENVIEASLIKSKKSNASLPSTCKNSYILSMFP